MSEWNAQTGDAVAENLRFLLMQSVGKRLVAEFWFGGNEPVRRCGTLTAVGTDYLLLTDEVNRQQIAGELCALRLATILADAEAEPAPEAEEAPAVAHTLARPRTQAAFNYARRKTRKLE